MRQRAEIQGFLNTLAYTGRHANYAKFSDSSVHCAVACILRFKPTAYSSLLSTSRDLQDSMAYVYNSQAKPNCLEIEIKKRENLVKILSRLLDSKFDRLDQVNDLFEVLYARRAVSPYDRHSGEICFPGGKLDKDEDEIEAASREVNEEIGLDVSDSSRFLYLGKLTDQLFTYYRKQQDVKVSVLLYLAADQDMKMTINPDEVDTAFWVPINSFFSYGLSNLEQKRATVKESVVLNALLKDEHSQWIDKNDAEKIKVIATEKYIFKYPSVTYPLWGLTMLMTSTLVQTWMNPLIDTHPMNKGKDFVYKAQYFKIDAEDEQLSAKLNNVIKYRNQQYLIDKL